MMDFLPEDILKLLLSILAGGLIGAEREYRDKAAGFRTIIFICVGATLFTIFSLRLGGDREPSRIASNIVSGVGFLGAGAILFASGRVIGLTTASTIWLAAALGIGIGGGYYFTTGIALIAALAVLWVFPAFENWINKVHDTHTYEVVCTPGQDKLQEIEKLFHESGLRVRRNKRMKSETGTISIWYAQGKPEKHDQLVKTLIAHPDVKDFRE
jgi:putative Mg2+ transporter-C (MgtC) family protein